MNVIRRIKSQNTSITSFDWIIIPKSSLPWSHQSSKFCLQEQSSLECYLTITCSRLKRVVHLYKLKLELRFINKTPNSEETAKFMTILNFSSSFDTKGGYTYELKKDANDDKLYAASKNIACTWLSQPILTVQVDIFIKTNYYINSELTKSLKFLMDSEKYSDLTLIVKNKTFKVHKNILRCRSKVLSNVIYKGKNELELHNVNPYVVKQLLNYIYTDNCNMSGIAHDLFKIAHNLEIIELQWRCKEYLFHNISIYNIVHILELIDIDKYQLAYLKNQAWDFVVSNEDVLVQNKFFLQYLRKSIIASKNIDFMLSLVHKYKLRLLYRVISEFICYIIAHKNTIDRNNNTAKENVNIFSNTQLLDGKCDKILIANNGKEKERSITDSLEVLKCRYSLPILNIIWFSISIIFSYFFQIKNVC